MNPSRDGILDEFGFGGNFTKVLHWIPQKKVWTLGHEKNSPRKRINI